MPSYRGSYILVIMLMTPALWLIKLASDNLFFRDDASLGFLCAFGALFLLWRVGGVMRSITATKRLVFHGVYGDLQELQRQLAILQALHNGYYEVVRALHLLPQSEDTAVLHVVMNTIHNEYHRHRAEYMRAVRRFMHKPLVNWKIPQFMHPGTPPVLGDVPTPSEHEH